jgi:hypothetical protein
MGLKFKFRYKKFINEFYSYFYIVYKKLKNESFFLTLIQRE